ncbi:aminoglycoside phosphotransferase family protein [Microbacterium sp. ZW T5_45]|uniref:aminoglycoside phosphotransferase family protein n=1 Tax=Microbacterium sp. ZW T5_45 TaxID=3378080 RepID=UPI0038551380
MNLHADEITIDIDTVRALIARQFPEWRDSEIRPVDAEGTVNSIFRIGDDKTARFPRTPSDAQTTRLEREAEAMREFALQSPYPAPVPLAIRRPDAGYPMPWTVQTWVPGRMADADAVARSPAFARDLAALLRALRSADTRGRTFSGDGRGGDLRDSDEWMQTCFRESEGLLPIDELRRMWAGFRELPRSDPDAMTHGDLTPQNLLIDGERLSGVLDSGGFGAADPALDLVAAWHLLEADARQVLRDELDVDDLQWRRGAAWAFQQSMGLVWYYRQTMPSMSTLGRSTLTRLQDAVTTIT